MNHRSLALLLALPLAIPLACGDDAATTSSSGTGGGSTGTAVTTSVTSTVGPGATSGSTSTSTTTSSSGEGAGTNVGGGAAGGGTNVGGGTNAGGDGPAGGNGPGGGVTTGGDGGAGSTSSGGTSSTGDAAASTGSSTTSTGSGFEAPTEIANCLNQVYECGDLVDNDGDGWLDSQDPDCLGPCDNTEDSFISGIPGGAGPACAVDCYFDSDSGSGNDNCYWDHACDPLSVAPDFYPEPANECDYDGPDVVIPPTGMTCGQLLLDQSDSCEAYCAPLVPNGCDCFGCCELPYGGGEFVWLGSEGATGDTVCSLATLDDPSLCHPCTPVQGACYNACDPCEICIGGPVPDPALCDPSGGGTGGGGSTGQQCPDGIQPCGVVGQGPCPTGQSCITGCCRDEPAP